MGRHKVHDKKRFRCDSGHEFQKTFSTKFNMDPVMIICLYSNGKEYYDNQIKRDIDDRFAALVCPKCGSAITEINKETPNER